MCRRLSLKQHEEGLVNSFALQPDATTENAALAQNSSTLSPENDARTRSDDVSDDDSRNVKQRGKAMGHPRPFHLDRKHLEFDFQSRIAGYAIPRRAQRRW